MFQVIILPTDDHQPQGLTEARVWRGGGGGSYHSLVCVCLSAAGPDVWAPVLGQGSGPAG